MFGNVDPLKPNVAMRTTPIIRMVEGGVSVSECNIKILSCICTKITNLCRRQYIGADGRCIGPALVMSPT